MRLFDGAQAIGFGKGPFPVGGLGNVSTFDIYHYIDGANMAEINFRDRKRIRSRLLAIFRENGKVTERDLLRLSALTGVNYSSIVEIHQSTRYQAKPGMGRFFRGRIARGR